MLSNEELILDEMLAGCNNINAEMKGSIIRDSRLFTY